MYSEDQILHQIALLLKPFVFIEPLLGPENGDLLLRRGDTMIILELKISAKDGFSMGLAELDRIIKRAKFCRRNVEFVSNAETTNYVLVTNMMISDDIREEMSEHRITLCTLNHGSDHLVTVLAALLDGEEGTSDIKLIKHWDSSAINDVLSHNTPSLALRLIIEESGALLSEGERALLDESNRLLAWNGLHSAVGSIEEAYSLFATLLVEELQRKQSGRHLADLMHRAESLRDLVLVYKRQGISLSSQLSTDIEELVAIGKSLTGKTPEETKMQAALLDVTLTDLEWRLAEINRTTQKHMQAAPPEREHIYRPNRQEFHLNLPSSVVITVMVLTVIAVVSLGGDIHLVQAVLVILASAAAYTFAKRK